MKSKNRAFFPICKGCIVEPICSDSCYVVLIFLNKGKKAATKFAKQGGWNSIEHLERDCGVYRSEYGKLSDYYLQVSDDGIDIKSTSLEKLKKKKIKDAKVVHGRLYIGEINGYILPHNRIAVDIDNLG